MFGVFCFKEPLLEYLFNGGFKTNITFASSI